MIQLVCENTDGKGEWRFPAYTSNGSNAVKITTRCGQPTQGWNLNLLEKLRQALQVGARDAQ